jgi:signal transduction histidine kinase
VTADVGALPRLPGPVASAVFQVAREALRNAVRHAGAAPHLTLKAHDGRLWLTVEDAGCGYDPGRVEGPTEGHLGLTLLRDAAQRVGGTLEIRTAPGEGTTVMLTVGVDSTPAGRAPSLSAAGRPPH